MKNAYKIQLVIVYIKVFSSEKKENAQVHFRSALPVLYFPAIKNHNPYGYHLICLLSNLTLC